MRKTKSSDNRSLVFGFHAVEAVLKHVPERVLSVQMQHGREDIRIAPVQALLKQLGIKIEYVARERLDALDADLPHQGVVAFIKPAPALQESELESLIVAADKPLLLVLDSVQDPHNLGACMRSAEAAGVNAVIVPRDKAVGLTAVVRKAASGAAELIPFVQVVNLARTLKQLQKQGLWIVGLAGEAEAGIYQAELNRPLALVLGAEGAGLRRLTREHCDELVHIPMCGRVESLNVSVAAGVCLFETLRQRTQ